MLFRSWELEASLVSKLEDTEGLAEQCNQALRKYEFPQKNFGFLESLSLSIFVILSPVTRLLLNHLEIRCYLRTLKVETDDNQVTVTLIWYEQIT